MWIPLNPPTPGPRFWPLWALKTALSQNENIIKYQVSVTASGTAIIELTVKYFEGVEDSLKAALSEAGQKVLEIKKVNSPVEKVLSRLYDIQDAKAKFVIADGKLKAYDMKAEGYNLNVDMKLAVDLETLYIEGNLWPKITSLPTVILSPITFLSDFMIDILIFGEVDDLNWKFGLDRNLKDEAPSATSKKGPQNYKPVAEKKR